MLEQHAFTGCGFNATVELNNPIRIASPGWPGDYSNNEDCNWYFRVATGFGIRVRYISFSLEENYDFFQVR